MVLLSVFCSKSQGQHIPSKKDIILQMQKVADWQLSQSWSKLKYKSPRTGTTSWEAGAFYPGIADLYTVTKEQRYLDTLKNAALKNHYDRGPDPRNADDQAIMQTYLQLNDIEADPRYLTAARQTLDLIMQNPKNGASEYSWCDLLFMGPPIWAHYAQISHDEKYLTYMEKIYFEAVENLQSEEYHLFYRDNRFKPHPDSVAKPVFWGRGNGWVFGGLCRIMDHIPKKDKHREKFQSKFIELATTLKNLQQADGFWKSNLLDPAQYPMGETSGTAFFCYGMAWGVNNGLLPRKVYLPVVAKAWAALNQQVHPDGKLGFVQPGGDRPYLSTYDMSNWYAAGAFLMAGKQLVNMK